MVAPVEVVAENSTKSGTVLLGSSTSDDKRLVLLTFKLLENITLLFLIDLNLIYFLVLK